MNGAGDSDPSDDQFASGGPHDAADLTTAIETALPDADLEAASYVERGENDAYLLTVDRGTRREDCYLKVGTRQGGAAFLSEPHFVGLVDEWTDVPVPTIHAAVGEGPLEDPFFVAEAVDGDHYERAELSPETFEGVCREAGRNLGDLHVQFPVDRFGLHRVTAEGTIEPAREFDDWPELFGALLDRNLELLAETEFEDLVPELRAFVDDAAPVFDSQFQPRLLHFDYRPGNLLLDPGDPPVTAGVIDWEAPLGAPAEFELAVTESILIDRPGLDRERRERLRGLLYEGYRESASLDRDDGFSERRRIYRVFGRVRMLRHLDLEVGDDPKRRDERAREHRELLDGLLG